MCANKSRIIGLLLMTVLSTAAAAGEEPHQIKLLIVTYDAAHVGPQTLKQAERIAATILLSATTQSRWEAGAAEDLRNLGMDFTAYSAKDCQPDPVPRVQILPHAPVGVPPNALGFSLPCARFGIQVTIYADRVGSVSESGGPSFGRVLGYAMAHELGHVLLHSGAHAAAGLMKASWSKSDWQRAAVDITPFSPAEARQIATLDCASLAQKECWLGASFETVFPLLHNERNSARSKQ
jgi:hypothetical protein